MAFRSFVILGEIGGGIALILGLILYWFATAVVGEPGSFLLGLACWISAAALISLLETGVI